jgi:hypothetical protein
MGIDCTLILRHRDGSISLHDLDRWWSFVMHGQPRPLPPGQYMPGIELKRWLVDNQHHFNDGSAYWRGRAAGILESFPDSMALITPEESNEWCAICTVHNFQMEPDSEVDYRHPRWIAGPMENPCWLIPSEETNNRVISETIGKIQFKGKAPIPTWDEDDLEAHEE